MIILGRLVVAGVALLVMVLSSSAMEAVRTAALVFTQSVMPALFPMMVLCSLMEKMPVRPMPKWLKLMETTAFCFLSGSPASAKRVDILVQNDEHFTRNALPLMGVCGVISPGFFLGTLQSRLPQGAGLFLLLCHWAGAVITGTAVFLWQKRRGKKRPLPVSMPLSPPAAPREPSSLVQLIPSAAISATHSLLSVLGAMMLMAVAASLISKGLSLLLPQRWQDPRLFACVQGLMEIAGGSSSLLDVSPVPDLPLLCGLCGFGGLSIWMQCLLFLPKKIRPGKLLLVRLFHGAVSYGICSLMMRFLSDGISAFAAAPLPYRFTGAAQNFLRFLRILPALGLPLVPSFFGLVRPYPGRSRTCSLHN